MSKVTVTFVDNKELPRIDGDAESVRAGILALERARAGQQSPLLGAGRESQVWIEDGNIYITVQAVRMLPVVHVLAITYMRLKRWMETESLKIS